MAKTMPWVTSGCLFIASVVACSSPEDPPLRAPLPDAMGGQVSITPARPPIPPIPPIGGPGAGGSGGGMPVLVPPPFALGGGPAKGLGSTKDVSTYNTGEQGCHPDTGCAGATMVGPANTVLREVWQDVPLAGYPDNTNTVNAFTSEQYSPRFPNNPDSSDQLQNGLVAHAPGNPLQPNGWGDNYGQRIRGFIRAPETGLYTFWLGSDDSSQLWFSLSTPDKAKPIAVVDFFSPWNSFLIPGQRSADIQLTEGNFYYIDIFHKEGGAGDFCEVRWTKPSDPQGLPGHSYKVVPPSVLYTAIPGTAPVGTGGTGGMPASGGAPAVGGAATGGTNAGGTAASGGNNAGGTAATGGNNAGGMSASGASGYAGMNGAGNAGMSGSGIF